MDNIEQLLKDYVATANNAEYSSDWDIINSKFPEFESIDTQVLKDYVATANNSDYNSNWDVINSKFPELFPEEKEVKKKGLGEDSSQVSGDSTSELEKEPSSSDNLISELDSSLEARGSFGSDETDKRMEAEPFFEKQGIKLENRLPLIDRKNDIEAELIELSKDEKLKVNPFAKTEGSFIRSLTSDKRTELEAELRDINVELNPQEEGAEKAKAEYDNAKFWHLQRTLSPGEFTQAVLDYGIDQGNVKLPKLKLEGKSVSINEWIDWVKVSDNVDKMQEDPSILDEESIEFLKNSDAPALKSVYDLTKGQMLSGGQLGDKLESLEAGLWGLGAGAVELTHKLASLSSDVMNPQLGGAFTKAHMATGSPLAMEMDKEAEEARDNIRVYQEESIMESFMAGNFMDGFNQGGNAFMESAPLTVALMASGPLGIAEGATLFAAGSISAGQKEIELIKRRQSGEDISDWQINLSMAGSAAAEVIGEKFTLGLINDARRLASLDDLLEPDALVDSWVKGLVKGYGIESSSEGFTEGMAYFTDVGVGLEKFDPYKLAVRIGDASFVGGLSGSAMHGGIRGASGVAKAFQNLSIIDKNTTVIFTDANGDKKELTRAEAIKLVIENPELKQQIRNNEVQVDYSMNEVAKKVIEDVVYGASAPDAVAGREATFEKEKAVNEILTELRAKEDGTLELEDITRLTDAVQELRFQERKGKYNKDSKNNKAINESIEAFMASNKIEIIDAVASQDNSMSTVTENVDGVKRIDTQEQYDAIKEQVDGGSKKPSMITAQDKPGVRVDGKSQQNSEVTLSRFDNISDARNAMKDFEAKQEAIDNWEIVDDGTYAQNTKEFTNTKIEELDEVSKETIDSKDYHILTSVKEGLTSAENKTRMDKMVKAIEDAGGKVHRVKGSWLGKTENSLLVTGINNATALDLGNQFAQESILSGKDGIMYMDGRVQELTGDVITGPDARRKTGSTTLNINGRKASISFNLGKTELGPTYTKENLHRLDEKSDSYDKEFMDSLTDTQKRNLGFVMKLVNSVGNLKVKILKNNEVAREQLKELGEEVKPGSEVGSFVNSGDGTIYLNMETMKGNTLFHEIVHPLVKNLKTSNPILYRDIEAEVKKSKLKKRAISGGRKEKVTYYDWAADRYSNRVQGLTPEAKEAYLIEEAFAEMIGDAAFGLYQRKHGPTLRRVRELLEALVNHFFEGTFPKNVEALTLDDMSLKDMRSGLAEALIDGREIEIGGHKFEVGTTQTELNELKYQLTEEESLAISKEVKGRVVEGKSVDTYKVIKTSKEKGKYVSFSGEINLDNVKSNSLPSYIGEASKLHLYNTTTTSPTTQLDINLEGALKKDVKTVIKYNKSKIESKIKSLEKSIAKNKNNAKKAAAVSQGKSDLEILKKAKKEKDLTSQLNLILSIENFNLKNSIYKETFFKLGDSGMSIKSDKDLVEYSESIFNSTKEVVKSNLRAVYNSVSANVRDISQLWYDGANLIAQDMASSYGVSTEQAAAIIATQSPQMPWFDNLLLADVIMDVLSNKGGEIFSREMFDYYVSKASGYKAQVDYVSTLEKSVGKKLSELNSYDKSIFIRCYFDLYLSRKAPVRIPTGTTTKFNQKGNSSFGGYATIEKAVSVFEDGSMDNISNNVGDANKVRNFYLNIANPKDNRAITIDTHAMAIALFKPLASNDNEVDFRPASFAFYAEAYRELANELGIEARALQSITWEAARAIFPAKKKANPKYKESINNLWNKYNSGELSLDELHSNIFNEGDNPNLTEWSNHIKELKDEKNRRNVAGRITRLGDVDTSVNPFADSKPNIAVSPTGKGDNGNGRKPGDRLNTDDVKFQEINEEDSDFKSNALLSTVMLSDDKRTPEQWVKAISEGMKGATREVASIGLLDALKAWQIKNNARSIPKSVVEEFIATNAKNLEVLELSDEKGRPIAYSDFNVEIDDYRFYVTFPNGETEYSDLDIDNDWISDEEIIDDALANSAYKTFENYVNDEYIHKGVGATHYKPITLPGGMNYREFLIKDSSPEDIFKAPHYDELGQNLIASARVDDRIGPNGEKILFVQEIQSDWVQGTNKGDFKTKDEIKGLENQIDNLAKEIDAKESEIDTGELRNKRRDLVLKLRKIKPYLPWNQTDLWVGLTIRKLINQASKEGYDQIAFVNGEQSDIVQRHTRDKKGLTHEFYNKIVPKNINNELKRLVKGMRYGVSEAVDSYTKVGKEGGHDKFKFIYNKNATINLTPELKEASLNTGVLKFQAPEPTLFNKPNEETSDISRTYIIDNSEELGIELNYNPIKITDLDHDNSKKIADEYEAMVDSPKDPVVQKAYEDMANETVSQYEAIVGRGYTLEVFKGEGEPYANSKEMIEDVRDNKHMVIFGTEGGFGETAITEEQRSDNAMLAKTEFKDVNGEPLLVNDLFRFVHDFFGHSELGNGFGPIGEENAWAVHSRMYSPNARRAMTTETRGQNSWVNFNKSLRREDGTLPKRGDEDYTPLSQRPFAEQKMGLLSDEVTFPETLKHQLPDSESDNVYTSGLVSLFWDFGMSASNIDYTLGRAITKLIDKKVPYDIRFTKLLTKPIGTHSNKEVKEIMLKARGAVTEQMVVVDMNIKAVKKANEEVGLTTKQIDDLLHNVEHIKALPEGNLRKALLELRYHIDNLSRTLIREDMTKDTVAFTIDSNMGVYVRKSYKTFEVKGWKQTDNTIKQKALEFLAVQIRKNRKDLNEAEVQKLAVRELEALMSPSEMKRIAEGSLDNLVVVKSLFEKRNEDIPQEIRDLWGEVDEPFFNYENTISKLSKTIAAERMFKELNQIGQGKFISDVKTGDTFNELKGAKWGVLEGKWVDDEMFSVMSQYELNALGEGSVAKVYNAYMGIILFAKKMKTVWSLSTHAKNVIGNASFAMMNGHFDVTESKESVKIAWQAISGFSNKEAQAFYQELTAMGVVASSASLQEIRNIAEDLGKNDYDLSNYLNGQRDMASKIFRTAKKPLNWMDDKAVKLYQMEDDMWKIYGYINEKARYIEAGMSEFEAKNAAALNIRNTYPNYGEVPRLIRLLGRSPFVGTFVAFQAEAVRCSKNAIKLGFEEIGSDNPKLRKIGAKRVALTLASFTALEALQATLAQLAVGALGFGSEEGEDEESKRVAFVAPWDASGKLIDLGSGIDEEGNNYFQYINLSATSGTGYIKDVFRLAFTDVESPDGEKATLDVLKKIYEPFLGEEMTLSVLRDIVYDPKGKVRNQSQNSLDQIFSTSLYAGEKLAPGIVRNITRIEDSFKEASDYTTSHEFISLLGVKINTVNVNKSLGYKMYGVNKEMINWSKGGKTLLGSEEFDIRNPNDVRARLDVNSPLYDSNLDAYIDEMSYVYSGALMEGIPESKVQEIMSKRGNVSPLIRSIVRNRVFEEGKPAKNVE